MTIDTDVDVVVVGAGLAGVTAARDLRDRGLSVLILEARDRVGGRTWSRRWSGRSEIVELGGTYFTPQLQPAIRGEIERYGIATSVSAEQKIENAMFFTAGELRRGLPVPAGELGSLEQAWIRVVQAATQLDPALPMAEQSLDGLDVSPSAFFDPLELPPATRELALAFLSQSCNPESYSIVHNLQRISGYGNQVLQFKTALTERFANGSLDLVDTMIEQSQIPVRLSSPVDRVARDGAVVTVSTRGGDRVRARDCVLAVPSGERTLGSIEIAPALSDAKRALIALPRQAKAYKVNMIVENAPPGLFALGWGLPFSYVLTQAQLEGGRSLLQGYGSEQHVALNPASVEAAQDALRHWAPEARVVSVEAHDWNQDPFAGYSASYLPPGYAARFCATMNAPEEAVVLAGADIADSFWNCALEGAVLSGHRAADQVAQRIG